MYILLFKFRNIWIDETICIFLIILNRILFLRNKKDNIFVRKKVFNSFFEVLWIFEDEEIDLQDSVNILENTMLVDEDLEFVDTSNIIHPADDVEAKWKLQDLFKDSLGQPAYLTLLINE